MLEKWQRLIEAAKNYWIDSKPTGMLDSEFDALEAQALAEGFSVRDYVFNTYLKGTRTKNQWIEKIKKTKVEGMTMLEAIKKFQEDTGESLFCNLKYDGSSIAIYLDPSTGHPLREVTVGNQNIDSYGIDQTWKLKDLIPKQFPKGIVALQAEALIDLENLPPESDPSRARQAVNGLINSKEDDKLAEVKDYLTLRVYRYYTDDSPAGIAISNMPYRDVLSSFEVVQRNNRITFAPADVFTVSELESCPEYTETDTTKTTTGTFLNDGWVLYNQHGTCLGALKYSGAGQGEVTKSKVLGVLWNNQVSKGKDSWSANVLIDPVVIKGSTIRKPSAGSVKKLISGNITPGAEVSIVLANSTIPKVGEVYKGGNGDFGWPTCSCGYKLGPSDIYGSNLKCGNDMCSERINRMKKTISGGTINLDKLLVIDRFSWDATDVSIPKILELVKTGKEDEYREYLMSYMGTDLQKRNMMLVWKASWTVLRDEFCKE